MKGQGVSVLSAPNPPGSSPLDLDSTDAPCQPSGGFIPPAKAMQHRLHRLSRVHRKVGAIK